MPLQVAAPRLLLDDCDAWTLNASLTRLSSYRKCSKRRILGHSAQATSLLPIEGTTKCSRIARGFGCGSSTGFAAEVKPKAGFGFRARAAFCERSNTFSLFPSLEPLLDATVSAPVLLFGRLSPTRRQEFPLSGRRRRTAQADLAELLPSAGIAAHILRRSARMSKRICDSWNAQSINQ